MWWRQKLGTHVVLLLRTISLTVGVVLVRNSVSTWALPIVWVAIVAAIALICCGFGSYSITEDHPGMRNGSISRLEMR
jgi:tellurite resistance protein TehA-like permease